ncbi:hypothetical protein DNK56_02260 [Streptomyces sp. AC1-42W]|nr:hypothetical protein DNK55_29310 [Streptomyces sp. AC1-42T]PZT81077.1 hypothetical protein DNK56_02260 [Streptomyces sp. AC1-42W]
MVPGTDDVKLFSNDAVKLDAVYLYADLLGSTKLARDFRPETAGKVIRASLRTASKIIKAREGEIRSYDGDRVMAIFIGGSKNTNAAKAALQINYAMTIPWADPNCPPPGSSRVPIGYGPVVYRVHSAHHSTGILIRRKRLFS